MIGFKITHDDDTITVGLEEGVTSISLLRSKIYQQKRDECRLHVGGLDSKTEQHCKWVQKELKVHDKFEIEVIDAKEFDEPFEWKEKMSKSEHLQHKLKYFKTLKEELESEGLI